MTVDLTKLGFYSEVNAMKRSSFVGSTSLAQSPGTVSHVVTHSLGYIPDFDVFSDLNNDGVIWAGEKVHKDTDSSSLVNLDVPTITANATTSTLTIFLDNSLSSSTGSRTIYWVIYLDYGTS